MKRVLSFVLLIGLAGALPALAQWEPDVRLTYNDSLSNTSYNNAWCVAASGSNVHVVWQDNRDGNWEIYAKRSTDFGSIWGADTRLTNNPSYSESPSVAASGSYIHVAWEDYRDGNDEIYYKRSTDDGLSWSTDTRLTNNNAESLRPSAAASGSMVHVVWWDYRDGYHEIYTKRSTDSGASWGPDTRLTNDPASSYFPSVAASGSNVHVVWGDYRDGNMEIYSKCSTNDGLSWGADTRLTNDSAISYYPSVAVSGSNVHLVWNDNRDGNYEIYTKRSTDSGASWGTDTRLTNNSALSYYPSVAASGSNVHLVWNDNRDGNEEIYTKRSTDSGASWGADTRLTNNGAWSYLPSAAASGSNIHVVWEDGRAGNFEIYYKRNPTGNVGVEFSPPHASRLTPYVVFPNPFTSFATLPGHEAERFSLYDVSGRKVGTYRGDRIGEGLAPGVYFLRSSDSKDKPLRIVKVR